MGRYDDIDGAELEERLRKLARLIRALDREGLLLPRTGSLLRLLGELRQMIFAYEVRCTRNLLPDDDETLPEGGAGEGGADRAGRRSPSGQPGDSERIVQEALERERELQDELRQRLFGERDEESE
jgi:hypothetical protein